MSNVRSEKEALAAALFKDADRLIAGIESLEKTIPESVASAARTISFHLSQVEGAAKNLSTAGNDLRSRISDEASRAAKLAVDHASADFRARISADLRLLLAAELEGPISDLKEAARFAKEAQRGQLARIFMACLVAAIFAVGLAQVVTSGGAASMAREGITFLQRAVADLSRR